MATDVSLTLRAEQDIDEAFLWFEKNQKGLGVQFYKEIRASLNLLGSSPNKSKIKLGGCMRELTMSAFPFVIVYEFTKREVRIYRVFRTTQTQS